MRCCEARAPLRSQIPSGPFQGPVRWEPRAVAGPLSRGMTGIRDRAGEGMAERDLSVSGDWPRKSPSVWDGAVAEPQHGGGQEGAGGLAPARGSGGGKGLELE